MKKVVIIERHHMEGAVIWNSIIGKAHIMTGCINSGRCGNRGSSYKGDSNRGRCGNRGYHTVIQSVHKVVNGSLDFWISINGQYYKIAFGLKAKANKNKISIGTKSL